MAQARNIPIYRPRNYWEEDPLFQKLIRRLLPPPEWAWAEAYFQKMGGLSAQTITPQAAAADRSRPRHIPYDTQGNRIDQIEYDESYLSMARATYSFGIIGLGQSPDFQKPGRCYGPLLKFGLGYLFSQSGSVLYCPICMTDGTLQVLRKHASPQMQSQWIPRLTQMDFDSFYDGAMYLTEVQGGSDVGANTCLARQVNGEWRLFGEKWFCSNVGSRTSLVLARPEGAAEGTAGLGLFLVPRDLEGGGRNAIFVRRIKEKLGTCEMATGEVEFQGALAYPVGDLRRGFFYMTDMLNLSRLYNAVWSVGLMRRGLLEARHYAEGRMAFGRAIAEYPLVNHTLEKMESAWRKALAFLFEVVSVMDRMERGQGSEGDSGLLRLYTPILKYFTAERAIESSHQAIEILAGNGCIEDFPTAKLLRDAQILAIWEGTANVLSLDLLRLLKKGGDAQEILRPWEAQIGELPLDRQAAFREALAGIRRETLEVLNGADGCGGELACRPLADHFAQFFQDLHEARLMGKIPGMDAGQKRGLVQ